MVRRKIIPVFNGFFIFVDLHRPGCSLGSMYCGRRLYSFFRYWIIECGFYFNLNICKDFVKFIAGLLVVAIYLSGFSDYFNFHFLLLLWPIYAYEELNFDGYSTGISFCLSIYLFKVYYCLYDVLLSKHWTLLNEEDEIPFLLVDVEKENHIVIIVLMIKSAI